MSLGDIPEMPHTCLATAKTHGLYRVECSDSPKRPRIELKRVGADLEITDNKGSTSRVSLGQDAEISFPEKILSRRPDACPEPPKAIASRVELSQQQQMLSYSDLALSVLGVGIRPTIVPLAKISGVPLRCVTEGDGQRIQLTCNQKPVCEIRVSVGQVRATCGDREFVILAGCQTTPTLPTGPLTALVVYN